MRPGYVSAKLNGTRLRASTLLPAASVPVAPITSPRLYDGMYSLEKQTEKQTHDNEHEQRRLRDGDARDQHGMRRRRDDGRRRRHAR